MLDYDLFIKRLFLKAGQTGEPVAGTFELTSRCNLNCKMCYIHRNKKNSDQCTCNAKNAKNERETAFWLDLAKQARDAGMLLLLLTGGEPLLRKDFKEIYLACREMGLLVSVNTNGTLIDDETVRFFKENPPLRLNISLYGASPETYGALCGDSTAFQKVINAITALKSAGVNIKLNYTVTPYNRHDAEKILRFATELDIPVQAAMYSFPPVRASGDVVRLSPEDAAQEHFRWQRNRLGDDGLREYLATLLKGTAPEEFGGDCLDTNGEKISCRAGSTSFWVTFDGQLTPCGMMPQPTLPIQNCFIVAWGELRSRRENIFLPIECKNCNLRRSCDMCAAATLAETGRFDGVPRYACEKAKEFNRLSQQFLNQNKKMEVNVQ